MYDTQKERFIDGLTIGDKAFGRVSCASNLYPFLEIGKEAEIYTWMHPFLGVPPIRTGIIGIVYPNERRAYVSGLGQMTLSLVMLALLPVLWVIPGLVAGSILAALHVSGLLVFPISALIIFSPWLAGLWMIWTQARLRMAYPHATTPRLGA
jgi:hypothetical protein